MGASLFTVATARYGRVLGVVIALLLAFLAGWQLGRTTSPYFSAQPIVFEDRECAECASAGGDAQELTALQQGTDENKQAQESPSPAADSGAVAGAVQSEAVDAATHTFVGSVNSNLFHDPTCPSANRIKEKNQVWFGSVEEAQAAGYSPSKCTQEKLGL